VRAAVLTTGRRTVTNFLRTGRGKTPGPMSADHRVCSQRRWSAWGLARRLITCLLDHVVPPGPVLLAGDETVTEPRGPRVCGQGRQRDGGRSPPRYTASRWGHTGVVVSGLVKVPFATRPWALPVVVALSRSPAWDRLHRRRHQTPAHLARLLLARLVRWFPQHHVMCMGDRGYGTSETARFGRTYRRHLTMGSKFAGDAARYAPPPLRTPSPRGRPRVKGQTLASPHEVVAHPGKRTSLLVTWSGGTTRAIEIVSGTGPWYRIGEALVEGRWVDVHDGTGTHRDEDFLTTEMTLKPPPSVEGDTPRWSVETTFQECRAYLKLESTQGDGQQTVLRLTPGWCGLYTTVVRRYRQLPCPSSPRRAVFWRGKATVTCSAMMTCVRRA
jgi:DDE superfamily endonuclease